MEDKLIRRLSNINELLELKNNVENKYGYEPTNLSSWHISNEYKNTILEVLQFDTPSNPLEYIYTYSYSDEFLDMLVKKISPNFSNKFSCLLTTSNTISILNVCNFIKVYNFKKVCILNPSYFSIYNTLDSFNINYDIESTIRDNDKYSIPFHDIIHNKYDLIIITSPIFSTGIYYDEENIKIINKLLENGIFVIVDESFASPKSLLIDKIDKKLSRNFISILSPHKYISINALKFSIILFHDDFFDFFEHWGDVFSGGITQSNAQAISHYLSPNYDICLTTFNEYTDNARNRIMNVLNNFSFVQYNKNSTGSMMTIYINTDKSTLLNDIKNINKLVNDTLTIFIPNVLNGFNSDILSFRLNLCLFNENYLHSLVIVLKYIEENFN